MLQQVEHLFLVVSVIHYFLESQQNGCIVNILFDVSEKYYFSNNLQTNTLNIDNGTQFSELRIFKGKTNFGSFG